jgi:hypothetical protein
MRALVFSALSIVLVSGCTTINKQALAPTSSSLLQNQTVTQTVRKRPDFSAFTAGNATFGLVGALAAISEGNNIIALNRIDDPSDAIAAGLSQALSAKHGTRVASPPIAVNDDDAKQIAATAKGKARFVVDVQTINWGFNYFPTDWTHYRVHYVGKARLIDVETSAVIAEGGCRQIPETNANAPTYDQLMANSAALLRQELGRSVAACIRSLNKEMFALDSGPATPDPAPLATIASGSPPPLSAKPGESVAGLADVDKWGGVMSCGARRDGGQNAQPYQVAFAMEVKGNKVTVHRETAQVLETLAGNSGNGSLQLRGGGYRLEEPSRKWQLAIDGDFPAGATTYTGTGSMFANGRALRACELKMTRNARQAL